MDTRSGNRPHNLGYLHWALVARELKHHIYTHVLIGVLEGQLMPSRHSQTLSKEMLRSDED